MAGEGTRFKNAGIDTEKWALPLAGKPVLYWVLRGFADAFADEQFCLIFRGGASVGEAIKETVAMADISSCRFHELPASTRGQAETVQLALASTRGSQDEPITIFNCDTLRPRFTVPHGTWGLDGYLECVKAPGDHWSFVRPASNKRSVLEVVEKTRISELCSTGLYRFGQRAQFEDAFTAASNGVMDREIFVAPLFNHLIDYGARVEYGLIGLGEVEFCGTPSEYRDCKAREEEIEAKFGPN